MLREYRFVECRGELSGGSEYTARYAHAVLCALGRRGVLTPEQLRECLKRLEKEGVW